DRFQRLAELLPLPRRRRARDRSSARRDPRRKRERMKRENETDARVPGPESRRIHAEEQRYIAPGLQRIALLSELTLTSGRGATVEDADGNRYVDFFAGVAVASLGHSHPHWVGRME